MDIECYEWEVMVQILAEPGLLASIRMLVIEWHLFEEQLPPSRYPQYLTMLHHLHQAGFELSFTEKSPGLPSCHYDLDQFRTFDGGDSVKLLHYLRETTYLNTRF